MKKTLIVATRDGALAVTQTGLVVSAIRKIYPDIDIRIKKITSQGDKDRRTTLWELKSTGFFTTALEDALLAGQADPPKGEVSPKADIAVHSFKDLPTAIREGLVIGAVLKREFPEDCLVSAASPLRGLRREGGAARIKSLDELPKGAKVGTSSLRRTVQLKRLRGDLECLPIRGNVNTRLRKLEKGDFDAIVLARAGLERLGLSDKISIVFDPTRFIPSPAQGALAVEIRADDTETKQIVSKLDDKNTRIETEAERLVFSSLECGCHAPAGAFAQVRNSEITVSAFYCEPDGKNYANDTLSGPANDYETIARALAEKISH
ncbi:MAG: hydroxymethylbilane synthase [Sedimentisphaerales bacterium]